MDERDLDIISDRTPKFTSAVLISETGEVTLLVPNYKGDDVVPTAMLAATELAMRLMDEPAMISELADAFEARVKS